MGQAREASQGRDDWVEASLVKKGNEGTKNFQVKAQSKETLQPSAAHRITSVPEASLLAQG